jgi:hypothetical protein
MDGFLAVYIVIGVVAVSLLVIGARKEKHGR